MTFGKTVPGRAWNSFASRYGALNAGAMGSGSATSISMLCSVGQDQTLLGICGQKPTQIFSLSPDGKEVSMLKNSQDWGPFVDGGDGYFYGSNWDGLAR